MDSLSAAAKIVLDFYMAKLNMDDSKEARFAEQYANLHMLKHRTQCNLDTLHAYDLKVS